MLRYTSLLCFAPLIVHAQNSAAQQVAFVAPSSIVAVASTLPADLELERRGARIGSIDIQVDDVFEAADSLAAPYRIANGLHMATRDATIADQLLFQSGDAYSRRLLDETARLLRERSYLNDAVVEPIRYHADNSVDVRVKVHDVWTLSPGFSFGRSGGANSTRVKFEDGNFLGRGQRISLARSSDVDRSAWRLAYAAPNLFGSRWNLGAAYASMSDGEERALSLERPFYALDTRWSANLAAADVTSDVSRYSLGERVESFAMREQRFDVGGGLSSGLRDGWTLRYLGGLRREAREFEARPSEPLASMPRDRDLTYPWLGVEVIEDDYVSTRNLDQIGRTEDLYLGRSARLELGLASTAFGSTQSAVLLDTRLQAGAELADEQYLINSMHMAGRLESGTLADGLFEVSSRYYRRQSPRRVFFAALNATATANLDAEEQLLLGGDNGLRGYPLRYQAGETSALLTLEERFYTDWQPFKLFNVGAAAFFDAGRTWGQDPVAAAPAGWLKDVGVGLRLGHARSGLGNVLHIDLAFPLDGGNDIESMQVLIETRRSF